ncbi:MAG: molybdopterin-dependent oxidoreductase, partial [Noviherbaspirillum sp.]
SDFALDGKLTPWLGMSIEEFGEMNRAFVIGSFLRKDHPLLAARLRHAAKRGAKVSILHASDDELLIPLANRMIKAPSAWLSALSEVVVAVAQAKGISAPSGFDNIEPGEIAKGIAASLLSGDKKAVVLGNAAAQHPQASQLHAAAQWIAQNTDAKFGYLTEAANTVGGYLANAIPGKGANALQMFAQARKAYVLLHAEPEYDSYDPQAARAALSGAEMVVALSPYKHGADFADVLLPIAPFAETSGTFVNCEGRAQGFNGSVKPLGETRPAWKVLRVLGNLLGLSGFDYETSEQIRAELLGTKIAEDADIKSRLNNIVNAQPQAAKQGAEVQLERVADVPIYFTDAIVRRAESLQLTSDAQAPKAWLSASAAEKLGVSDGMPVKVTQGQGAAVLAAAIDVKLPANVIRVAAGHPSTTGLGGMFGAVSVEKA